MLERHICGLESCDVGILLGHLQHTVEEGEHGNAVAAMLLAVGDDLPEHHHLAVVLGPRVKEQCPRMLHGQRVVLFLVIVVKRHLGHLVVGLLLEHAVEFTQRLFLLSVFQEPVTHHHPVVVVAGMLAREFLELIILLFLVALQRVDLHLGERDVLGGALDGLHAVEHLDHLVVFLLLLVEREQKREHIDTAGTSSR